MPDRAAILSSSDRFAGQASVLRLAVLMMLLIAQATVVIGCAASPRNPQAIRAYYRYDFTTAREELRGNTYLQNDEQTILNHLRLGSASMADGDLDEAERAFRVVFDLLSTAGLNEDRTTAAVLIQEDVRIWKGEPFEQALAYVQIGTLYALRGDWENARAAVANALFRLADFGVHRSRTDLARRAARDELDLDTDYQAVESNFGLGFLLLGTFADLSGAAGAREAFGEARRLLPEMTGLIDVLESRAYDTLLIVEYGKGPTKTAYGPDEALSTFRPRDRGRGALVVQVEDAPGKAFPVVTDVNSMAADLRWNALEDVRLAKSTIGDGLLLGGAIVAFGSERMTKERALIGAGMMLAGFLSKSGARADTRYNEFNPQRIFIVPLMLEHPRSVHLHVTGGPASGYLIPDLQPGVRGSPRAIYARLHGSESPQPGWLTTRHRFYTDNSTGPRHGDGPWILGGGDLSTPSRELAEFYHAGGWIDAPRAERLRELYTEEDILIGSGMENRPNVLRNPSYRHVLEGGRGLFTPHPYSMGSKRLMYQSHPIYRPRSDTVRNAAEAARVRTRTNDMELQP